jgi:hypothetical protein
MLTLSLFQVRLHPLLHLLLHLLLLLKPNAVREVTQGQCGKRSNHSHNLHVCCWSCLSNQ